MSNNEILNEFYVQVSRQAYIVERIIREEYRKAIKKMAEEEKMNKWHDLRKDPTDLPKECDEYWVMIDGCPTVEADSFDPGSVGREISSPIIKDRKIVGNETYPQSGWWENSKPGQVTHWMAMEKPPRPEPPTCD